MCVVVICGPDLYIGLDSNLFCDSTHNYNSSTNCFCEVYICFDKFASWLSQQRNDLEAPARNIAPQVDDALKALGRMPQVVHAGMSGSGATCYGLVRTIGDARQVARTLQVGNMGWWVAPAPLL